jgi:hypothetical protein
MLVQYADLIQHRAGLVERLCRFAGLECSENVAANELESHRTSSSPEMSIGRWRRESLPKGVLNYLETYLQESMAELNYEPAASGKVRPCPGVEFAQPPDQNGRRVLFQNGQFGIHLAIDPFPSSQMAEIWASFYGPAVDQVSLTWETPQHSIRQRLSLSTYAAHHWQVLRFLVGRHESWNGRITKLHLEMSSNGKAADSDPVYFRWLRLVE